MFISSSGEVLFIATDVTKIYNIKIEIVSFVLESGTDVTVEVLIDVMS